MVYLKKLFFLLLFALGLQFLKSFLLFVYYYKMCLYQHLCFLVNYLHIYTINYSDVILKNNYKINVNPHKVNPIYLKLTEAEEKLNDKNN